MAVWIVCDDLEKTRFDLTPFPFQRTGLGTAWLLPEPMVTGFDGVLEAHDELQLLCLPVQQARQWISRHPNFNRAFLTYLGRQMHTLTDLAGNLALHDTETRLAKLLLHHLHPHGSAEHTQ